MDTTTKVITNQVTEIYVHVRDYDIAIAWYTDVLGLSKDAQGRLDMNGARILLIESDKRNPATHAVFSLFSSDINAAHEILRSKGAQVDEIYYCPYEKTTSFHVTDSEGYLILIKDC
ncbi:glyoxalase/bleomycin resistance protein/dioxygenase superfamily protein [Paenibacillus cellulosilyticus]|uniref:Glyoxalase/bleomycin resistance protein/dioxygenase superfamily protein n=1 Tax=Paenibacillus cellulosilyticus TaxID=375489 RepID=A0A2V2YUR1_9BACL|nr:VOC family protein [Paenibacillus cellulosilyticus]PWW05033.1 glyoxalase/bleomycin resistance protein/dioxygenase superfamily protein [Paenibacillus cellulosilyticus]QKS48594.1 VOC family protein [Paenibacillus cellulosilyticus]